MRTAKIQISLASAQSDQSLSVPHEEFLDPWLTKGIDQKADHSLRWMHMTLAFARFKSLPTQSVWTQGY